jgi:NAD(P)-dependent dehydrogenase (short-subunit alcohol dehydrogenase family)
VASIGSDIKAIRGDVSKLSDLDRIVAQIGKEKGRIGIVFANVGGGPSFPSALSPKNITILFLMKT